MTVAILHGDCLSVLPTLEAESFHACVTDPPYHLTTGKKGGTGVASLNVNSPAGRVRISTGFMGTTWDGGDVAFRPETWAAVHRVLKPGAFLLAFGGTRTFHRLVCAIEDAGFEVRDTIMWLYGSGFPKSHDVSKAIDRKRDDMSDIRAVAAWLLERFKENEIDHRYVAEQFGFAECMVRHWLGKTGLEQTQVPKCDQWLRLKGIVGFGDEMDTEVWRLNRRKRQPGEAWFGREVVGKGERNGGPPQPMWGDEDGQEWDITAPTTEAAREWQGWGTALKPACELICVARKPLDPSPERVELTPEVLATWEASRCDHA